MNREKKQKLYEDFKFLAEQVKRYSNVESMQYLDEHMEEYNGTNEQVKDFIFQHMKDIDKGNKKNCQKLDEAMEFVYYILFNVMPND